MNTPPLQKRQVISVRWVIRMRWLAVLCQLLAALFAQWIYEVVVPWTPVVCVLLLTALSNLALRRLSQWVIAGLPLWIDVFLLTTLIYYTGGAHNPFTSFYLLHIALAAMTVRTGVLWSLVMTCIAGYVAIFFYHRPIMLGDMELSQGCASYSWHLQGMLIAFIITAVFIAAFVSRMHRVLIQQDVDLENARIQAEKNAHFASLATLAAGVAHELGSPLATISLASSELLHDLKSGVVGMDAVADAHLIQQQTQRCRSILDRLSQRNTDGLGEIARAITVAQLWSELRATLRSALITRVSWHDFTKGASWYLPLGSVTQAVAILLNNAEQADPGDREIRFECRVVDEQLQLAVYDRGAEPAAHVFACAADPFFTTKDPGEGMGLGLFLVKSLALRLGGEFRLSRTEDEETVALLSLVSVEEATRKTL